MLNQSRIILSTVCISVLFTACEAKKPADEIHDSHSQNTENHTSQIETSNWPTLQHRVTKNAEIESQIDKLIAQMSLREKVGQMTQAEITWLDPKEIKDYHLGSVLNGGGTFLNDKRHAEISEWVDYMDTIYDISMDDSDGHTAIPITYGIDAVHGNNKFASATLFPHNIGLGATRNPELIKRIGEITALEVLVTGIDWTFAPTLAVVRDDRWGRTYEGYSEDPKIVAEYAKAMTEGVQGTPGTDSFLDEHHVYATAKHWLGDGGTQKGDDQGDNQMSESDLMTLQAQAYFPAIENGIQSIMASHNSWHGKKLHGHHYLLTEVLKQKLGFDGFIVGDWNAHGRVAGCTNDSCAQAVNAGLDMFMVVEDYKAFIDNTVADVEQGKIKISRIDDAVRRILRVKIRSGLFEKGRPSSRPYSGKTELMGAQAHRDVARQAVRESLVLLKNNQSLLPLDRKQHVLVAGDGADNIGKQSGGWTISWQSDENTNADFKGASSIFAGIKKTVESSGGSVELNEAGEFSKTPDVAIVVIGENPYAEWHGDIETIAYKPFSKKDAELLESLQNQNIPVVTVFLSGRPLWVNRELNASDAFIAAWLPGSEGDGIAEVIFKKANGQINYDFSGKLSFSWPKKASQTVINIGDAEYDPLFAYGFGLSYKDTIELPTLDTLNDHKVELDINAPYPLLAGKITEPWQIVLDDGKTQEYLSTTRTANDAVSIMEADKLVQGDSQEFSWTGHSPMTIGFSSPYYRTNLDAFIHGKGVVSFDIRTITDPSDNLSVRMGCAAGYCGDIPLNKHLAKAASNEWRTITIDLQCFAREGVEFSRLHLPFALFSKAKTAVRIANIAYMAKPTSPSTVSCED